MRRAEEFVYQGIGLGLFEIDSDGRVWRVGRQIFNAWTRETTIVSCARRRAETRNSYGYAVVTLALAGQRGAAFAHRCRVRTGLLWNHVS